MGDVLFFLGALLRMEFLCTKSHLILDFRMIYSIYYMINIRTEKLCVVLQWLYCIVVSWDSQLPTSITIQPLTEYHPRYNALMSSKTLCLQNILAENLKHVVHI